MLQLQAARVVLELQAGRRAGRQAGRQAGGQAGLWSVFQADQARHQLHNNRVACVSPTYKQHLCTAPPSHPPTRPSPARQTRSPSPPLSGQ